MTGAEITAVSAIEMSAFFIEIFIVILVFKFFSLVKCHVRFRQDYLYNSCACRQHYKMYISEII